VSDPAPLAVAATAATSSRRLVVTLAACGVIAGVLLAAAYHSTLPAIEATRAAREKEAVREVLGAPPRIDVYYRAGGLLVTELPAGATASETEKVFRGVDAAGKTVGWALKGSSVGYADAVVVLFGWDPATRRIVGMKVLEQRETPGLGDKVQKDEAFAGGLVGRETPLVPVKPGKGTGGAREVDTISGATISSRAVYRAINEALGRWEPMIAAAAGGDGRGG
jgi:electron transport complex protein RnfG